MGGKKFRSGIILCCAVFAALRTTAQIVEPRKPVAVHFLSDCSGRIFGARDLVLPPRDIAYIDLITKTLVSSKKGYGISLDSFEDKQGVLINLELKDEIIFYPAGANYFPKIFFSSIRTGGVKTELSPPEKNYMKLAYRANYKRDSNFRTLGDDLKELEDGILFAYQNELDKDGVNILAELEYYISEATKNNDYSHIFILFTDGFVNSSHQLIWSPNMVTRALSDDEFFNGMKVRANLQNLNTSKLILLETGGYDYNPTIGRTGKRIQNDVLKMLWNDWASSAGFNIIWQTKWDEFLTPDEIEKIMFD